jgi:hypothetical protein
MTSNGEFDQKVKTIQILIPLSNAIGRMVLPDGGELFVNIEARQFPGKAVAYFTSGSISIISEVSQESAALLTKLEDAGLLEWDIEYNTKDNAVSSVSAVPKKIGRRP